MPDLVLFEVLRGFRLEHELRAARQLMQGLEVEAAVDPELAVAAAEHYRQLRGRGHTVRSAVDVLVAAFCIERDYALLHDDRDFDAFELHRGLRVWRHWTGCSRSMHVDRRAEPMLCERTQSA